MNTYYKTTTILITSLLLTTNLFAQIKRLHPKVYSSEEQKLVKGSLGNMSEETLHQHVIVKVLLNKYDFIYPNHEHADVHVTMTDDEYQTGLQKEEDFAITSSPIVKTIYFMRDKMEIWVDFTNGETIFYFVKPIKATNK